MALRWVQVPCEDPDYKDTKRWIRAHDSVIHRRTSFMEVRLLFAWERGGLHILVVGMWGGALMRFRWRTGGRHQEPL